MKFYEEIQLILYKITLFYIKFIKFILKFNQ